MGKTSGDPTAGLSSSRLGRPEPSLEELLDDPHAAQDIAKALETGVSTTGQTAAPTLPVEPPWFDPTMTTEGLWWCPDLTASDPTLFLPVLFSTTFFASIYFSPRLSGGGGVNGSGTATGKATNMQRIGMTVAMLSIVPALQMPVALLLYYIANIGVSAVHTRWLAYTVPVRPVPTACRRPIRVQPLKQMLEEGKPAEPRKRRVRR